MKYYSIIAFLFLLTSSCSSDNIEKISFQTSDGVSVTADLYRVANKEAPFIILFHQARYSRGEYREIAPKLNRIGYNCLAIDQRSGKEVNGIKNETYLSAKKLKKKTEFVDAIPDLEAALNYAMNELSAKQIIVWGSSYSSSLVFYLGSKYPEKIQAILSFSPGEYFTIDGKKVKDFAAKVSCPVFITSATNERDSWKDIYEAINTEKQFFLPETEGFHGSKALWSKKEGYKKYWSAVNAFLKNIK